MAGPKITRRAQNYYFVQTGDNAASDAAAISSPTWAELVKLMTPANEVRVMEFDPGTPSSPEESESSYGDDQAFTFSGAEQSGTASIQVLEATAADGRLVATQAAAAKKLIDLDVDKTFNLIRVRTTDLTRLASGELPAANASGGADSISNGVAYYFRGKKRNPRAIDGSPMDRYGMDIVLSQRPVRVEQS